MPRTLRLQGWPVTCFIVLIVLGLVGGIVASAGTDEAALRMVIRVTAQGAVLLFATVFAASSMQQLFAGRFTAWILRNRRYLGVAVAVIHTLHLATIVIVRQRFGTIPFPWLTIIFGGLAFLFLWSMALTSSDKAVRVLGPPRWRRLHKTGMYYIWLLFLLSYAKRAQASAFYTGLTLLLLAALTLRISAFLQSRKQRTARAAPTGAVNTA